MRYLPLGIFGGIRRCEFRSELSPDIALERLRRQFGTRGSSPQSISERKIAIIPLDAQTSWRLQGLASFGFYGMLVESSEKGCTLKGTFRCDAFTEVMRSLTIALLVPMLLILSMIDIGLWHSNRLNDISNRDQLTAFLLVFTLALMAIIAMYTAPTEERMARLGESITRTLSAREGGLHAPAGQGRGWKGRRRTKSGPHGCPGDGAV